MITLTLDGIAQVTQHLQRLVTVPLLAAESPSRLEMALCAMCQFHLGRWR